MKGTATGDVDLRAEKTAWWRSAAGRLTIPTGEAATRLTLLGIVVALQNGIELPRDLLTGVLGTSLTGLLIVLMLGGSLALALKALREPPPSWRWLTSRKVQAIVLVATLAAIPTGLHQIGAMTVAGIRAPDYPNDGTTLDHYAAQQLLDGSNPYVTVNIFDAVAAFRQDPAHTTPLRCGPFASRPATAYPTNQELRAVFTREAAAPQVSCAFESHVSYPALSFLALVPFVWAGFPSVVIFFALCFAALVILLLLAVPPALRSWVALLTLADAPLLDATVGGVLDVFYILLLFAVWRWMRRPLISTLLLGLALATKQLAWFFAPFYAILVWREQGWREAIYRLAGAGAVFAAINAPFAVANPHAFLTGILAPEVDPMFPLGNGLVKLSLVGIVPLAPSVVYTILEVLALGVCLGWYWRYGKFMPEMGFVLAVVPLFFAWRSLTTYFYFVALPAGVLLLARVWREPGPSSPGIAAPVGLSDITRHMRQWFPGRVEGKP